MSPPEVDSQEQQEEMLPPPPAPEPEEEMRLELPKRPKYAPPPPPAYAPKRIETLEDLYYHFPDIGDGSFKLRVKRVAPKSYSGHIIAGWLGDLDEKLSIDEFKAQFGGGRYQVCVMGPPKGRHFDGDVPPVKQLTSDIEILIPGPPAAGSFPMNQEEMPMSMGGMRPGYMEPPAVTMKRLDLDHKEREYQRQVQERSSTAPEHIVKAWQDSSESRSKQIMALADSKNDLLREQNQALLKAIEGKDVEIRSLREEIMKTRTDANEAVRRAETELEKRLKESHDKVIETLKEGHNREYRDIKEQATKEIRELESRYRERLDEANRNYNTEMTRRENDARTERERLVRDSERSEKSLKDSYEARISDLTRTTEREIQSVKEQRDREILSLKTQYESTNKSSEATASFRIQLSDNELGRLRTEVESLRRENERLLKASIKDPITFLNETKMVATDLLGMVPAEDAKGGDDGPLDWKKMGAKAVLNLIEKLPETAKGVTESISHVRQQNQQNAAAAQQMAQRQQQQQQPAGPRGLQQGQPQPQQQGQRRRMAPPPQTWQGTPPAYVGPVTGAELPFHNPYTPLAHHQQQQQMIQQPLMQQPQFQIQEPQIQQQPVQQQPQQPQEQQVQEAQQPQQQPSQEQAKTTQDGIELFIHELNEAYKGDMIPAAMFAKGFVEQLGKEQALHWLNQISAEQFLEELSKTGKDVALFEMDGRKYVKTVWAEARKFAEQG